MNPVLEVIEKRRSLRAYSDQPVSPLEKETILHAALRAPTAGNMMLYSIIEVEEQTLKDRLALSCDNQPFIARAPYVLLFLADYQRWFDYYTHCEVERRCGELGKPYRVPQEGDMLLACCDALIAAQTAVLAAESLGIGSCYIGDILERYETHRDLFQLPPYVLPITLVCFGHPASEHAGLRQTPRFEPEYVVFKNRYQRLSGEDFERMFAGRSGRLAPEKRLPGAENFGQHEYFRKFIAEFSLEMNRSAREILKNWS